MSSPEDEDIGPPPSKRSRRGLVQDQEQEDEEEEDAQFEVQDLWKVKLFSGSCETCKATFTDPAYLLVHRPCYFGTSAFAPSPATAPDGKQYGCKFCVKRFPSLEQIRQHIRFHLEKRYYCKFCEYRGSSQYDVKYHSESVHARQIPDYLRNKNKHKGYKSVGRGRRPTPSASYGQSYARSPGHSSDSRALVPAVGSSSSGYSSAAAASLSLMLADRGLENESSEWGFSNMKLDDIHGLEDFYTIRPFSQVCKSCNGMFDDQGTFYAHEPCLQTLSLVQNGEYRCQLCNRLFKTIAQLRMHCLYHGEKRFRCRHCSNAYHVIGEIKRHVPVHAELHPCGWPACPKKFTTLSARQQHYDTAHINRLPYVCEVCSFGFLTLTLFQKHNATRHAGKVTPAASFSSSNSSSATTISGVLAIGYHPPATTTVAAAPSLLKDQTAMKSTSSLTRSPMAAAGNGSPVIRSNITSNRFSQIPNEELDKHYVFICPKRKCNTCRTTFMDPTKHAVHEPCYRDTHCYRPHNPIMHRYGCPLCTREAEKMGKLRDHMFMHFENVLKCTICGCLLPSLRTARKHVAGHLESNYTCNIPCRQPGCRLFFRTNEERLRHMEQNHRRSVASLITTPAAASSSASSSVSSASSSGIRTRSSQALAEPVEDERTRRIREQKRIADTLSTIKVVGDGSFIPHIEYVISYIKIIASEESKH